MHQEISMGQVEQRTNEKTLLHPAPYTPVPPHRDSSFIMMKEPWSSVSIRIYTTQSYGYFRPVPNVLWMSFLTSIRLWGERFRRHNNSRKQQRFQPNIFAVTVVVVARGRSLYNLVLCFPAASQLVSVAPTSSDQAQTP